MNTKDKLIEKLKELIGYFEINYIPTGIIYRQWYNEIIKYLPSPIKASPGSNFQPVHAKNIIRKLKSEIAALDKQVEEQESKRLTDAEITARAKIYARDHSEAPDKDCPVWIEHDYCAGAVMAREFYTGVIQDLGKE